MCVCVWCGREAGHGVVSDCFVSHSLPACTLSVLGRLEGVLPYKVCCAVFCMAWSVGRSGIMDIPARARAL